ncbi:MAG: flagellar biosynthesis protein FlhA [Thiotrichales bacterium]|jgi:flagellar biosynthesis protein FlhA|nr:flagellar biosynthesis protein FlhA [Thiotrichales bacterium]
MDWRSFGEQIKMALPQGMGTPVLVVALLAMMILPLPPLMLDILFTFNIALSLMVLMVTVYAKKPLDFAVFPTILLVTTLLRLALNIASTRVILLEGHNGGASAGHVIEAFGEFVIGGNYAVGLVVFAILVVINFVVVTKGAGRVAEVSARFALDSMPGKQMAIDADLNAGLISQDQAQARRREVAAESEFYGSMDGASKFVRGDAIAGIIILFINIIGGFIIGMAQHGLPFGQSVQTYTLLTIGDGLVAQIPALLLSVAAALMVTRSGDDRVISDQMGDQLLSNPRPLAISAGIMTLLGIIPGMPNMAFLTLAAVTGGGAWFLMKRQKTAAQVEPEAVVSDEPERPPELGWDDVQQVDVLGLEIGYRLIPMVDTAQDGQLLERIKGVRRKLSQEFGFLIPSVHIRDNLELSANQYRISMMGVTLGTGEVYHDRDLAINSGQVYGQLNGVATKDPTFGLDAVWISKQDRDQAQTLGYTVVDSGTVIATHLSQILQDNIDELLGLEEVQHILDRVKLSAEKLVEEVNKEVPIALLVQILQNLLRERIPVRDMRTILEALLEKVGQTKDIAQLTMHVRTALGKFILQTIPGVDEVVEVMTLDPSLEQILLKSMQGAPEGQLAIEPSLAERMSQLLSEQVQRRDMEGKPSILLVNPFIRAPLARLFRYSLPALYVLSYSEIPESRQINVFAAIG